MIKNYDCLQNLQDFESARNILKKQTLFEDDDDEEVDTINWDGSSITASGKVGRFIR